MTAERNELLEKLSIAKRLLGIMDSNKTPRESLMGLFDQLFSELSDISDRVSNNYKRILSLQKKVKALSEAKSP